MILTCFEISRWVSLEEREKMMEYVGEMMKKEVDTNPQEWIRNISNKSDRTKDGRFCAKAINNVLRSLLFQLFPPPTAGIFPPCTLKKRKATARHCWSLLYLKVT